MSDILKEGSTKLTYFVCADAQAVIGYIGIGEYRGRKPSDWLMSLAEKVPLGQMRFHDALVQIALAAEEEIAQIPVTLDRRHTFYIGAFANYVGGGPCLAFVSNFERIARRTSAEPVARRDFEVSWLFPLQPGAGVLATGATETLSEDDLKDVKQLMREGAAATAVRKRCVKIVKDAEFRRQEKGRLGTSGTSVTWAVVEIGVGCEVGLDVPGGTTVKELPNQIHPNFLIKAPFVDLAPPPPGAFRKNRIKTVSRSSVIVETRCPHCGATVPEGYRRCGVCNRKMK